MEHKCVRRFRSFDSDRTRPSCRQSFRIHIGIFFLLKNQTYKYSSQHILHSNHDIYFNHYFTLTFDVWPYWKASKNSNCIQVLKSDSFRLFLDLEIRIYFTENVKNENIYLMISGLSFGLRGIHISF